LPEPTVGSVVHEDNFGEFGARVLIFEHTKDLGRAVQAAAGWDGDRFQLVNTRAGEALAWFTVWDTTVEAAEFRDAMERVIEKRFRTRVGAGGDGAVRNWVVGTRRLHLSMETVAGRPAVIYEDLPVGLAGRLIAPGRVTLLEVR
jgi:hypothetical protein